MVVKRAMIWVHIVAKTKCHVVRKMASLSLAFEIWRGRLEAPYGSLEKNVSAGKDFRLMAGATHEIWQCPGSIC